LPSFGLANRQKHVYFRTIFSLEYGYPAVWLRDFMSPATTRATTDLFWRHAPLLGLQFNSRCPPISLPAVFLVSKYYGISWESFPRILIPQNHTEDCVRSSEREKD
jgi:hypothetical protein